MKRKEILLVVLVFQFMNVFCKPEIRKVKNNSLLKPEVIGIKTHVPQQNNDVPQIKMKTHVSRQNNDVSQIIFEFAKHPKIDRIETRKNEELRLSFTNVFLEKKEAKDAENKIKSINLVKNTSVVSDSNGTTVTIAFKKDSVTPIINEQNEQEGDPSSLTVDIFDNGLLRALKWNETTTYREAKNSFGEILDFDQAGFDDKKKTLHIKIV
jgi:hypothetical protein